MERMCLCVSEKYIIQSALQWRWHPSSFLWWVEEWVPEQRVIWLCNDFGVCLVNLYLLRSLFLRLNWLIHCSLFCLRNWFAGQCVIWPYSVTLTTHKAKVIVLGKREALSLPTCIQSGGQDASNRLGPGAQSGLFPFRLCLFACLTIVITQLYAPVFQQRVRTQAQQQHDEWVITSNKLDLSMPQHNSINILTQAYLLKC